MDYILNTTNSTKPEKSKWIIPKAFPRWLPQLCKCSNIMPRSCLLKPTLDSNAKNLDSSSTRQCVREQSWDHIVFLTSFPHHPCGILTFMQTHLFINCQTACAICFPRAFYCLLGPKLCCKQPKCRWLEVVAGGPVQLQYSVDSPRVYIANSLCSITDC